MNILMISDKLYDTIRQIEFNKDKVTSLKWDDAFPTFFGTNNAILLDFSSIDVNRMKIIKSNLICLEKGLNKKSINNDNLIVVIVCGSENFEWEDDEIHIADEDIYTDEDKGVKPVIVKRNAYEFLRGLIPDFKNRVDFITPNNYFELLSIKQISISKYLAGYNDYYLIFRYDYDAEECRDIFPIAKAKKTGNACISFEHRIGKGTVVFLPGYGTRDTKEAVSLLLRICKNYFKTREGDEELRINLELPKVIRENYEEALMCFLNDLFNASCVMCGRTLEGLYKEIGIMRPRGKFVEAHKALSDKGLLYRRTIEAGDKIKINRNSTAHFTETLDSVELKDIHVDETTARQMIIYLKHCLEDLHPLEETKKKFQPE